MRGEAAEFLWTAFLLTIISVVLRSPECEGKQAYVCPPSNHTELSCSSSEWVKILAEMYAPQKNDTASQCDLDSFACNTIFHDRGLKANCNGQREQGAGSCHEEVDIAGSRKLLDCVGDEENIAAVVQYECVDESSIWNMCDVSSPVVPFTHQLYLATPNFPRSPGTGERCTCQIEGSNMRMSAVQIDVKAELPWALRGSEQADTAYDSVLAVTSGQDVLWKSNQCSGCSQYQLLNSNLLLPGQKLTNLEVTYSDYGLENQNAWLFVRDLESGLNISCSTSALPSDRIITTTTTTTTTTPTTTTTTTTTPTPTTTTTTPTTTPSPTTTTTATTTKTTTPTTSTTTTETTTTPTTSTPTTTTTEATILPPQSRATAMKRPTSTDAVTSPNVPVAPSSLDPMSTTTHGGTQGPGPTSEGDTGGSDSSSTVVILVVVLLALFVVALILGIFIFRRRKDLKETKFGGIRSMLSSWFRHVTCRGRRSSEGDIYDNDLTFPRLPEEPVSNTRLSIIPPANFVCLGESQPPQQDTYSTDNALDNRRSGVFHDSEEVYDDALIYNPYDIVYDNVIREEGVNSVTGDTKSRKPSKLSGDSSSPAKSLPSPEKIIEEKDQQNSNPTASPVIYEKKQLRPTSGTAADSCHDETGVTVKPGDGEERLTIKNDLYQLHQEMLDEELTRIRMDRSRKFHSSPADHSPKPQREPDTNSSTILRQPKDVESGTALGSRHPKDTQPETAPVRGRETTEHRVQDSSKTSSIDNANDPSKHEHSIKIRKKKRQPKDNSSHDSHTQSVKPNKSSKQQPHHQEQAHLSQEEQQFFHELGISTDATEQPESMSLRDKKESSNHSFESKAPTSKKEIDSQAKSVHVEEPRLTKSTNSIKDGHTESSPVARKLLHGTKRESDSRPKKGASHSAPAKSDNKTGKKPAKPELVSNIIQMSLDGIKEKRRAESPNVNSEISDDKAEAIGNESSNF